MIYRLVEVQLEQRQVCVVSEAPHGVVNFSRGRECTMFAVMVCKRRCEAVGGA